MKEKILTVRNLVTQFRTEQGTVTAVNGVSFDVYPGKTLGIVGESGSGKSVTALSVMRLINGPVGNIVGGAIWLGDQDLCQLPDQAMRTVRGSQIAMIFQEPMTSLNPVFTIGYQISEALTLHQPLTHQEARDQAIELLSLVGIPAPAVCFQEYPHQLSGGMQQRAMIAMALAGKPTILIADEPTTALDVTIQAQILDLLTRLQEELGMGIIFITHDLGVVAEVCHEVAVMYAGKIVEQAPVQTLLSHPKHPYTQGLLNAIPTLEPSQNKTPQRLATIRGVVPALTSLPPGCSFQDRCQQVQPACRGEQGPPPLEEKSPSHWAACFYPIA
ncbi:MAG: ABC transporter ATP-binding protein [Bacteroidota bacterium]